RHLTNASTRFATFGILGFFGFTALSGKFRLNLPSSKRVMQALCGGGNMAGVAIPFVQDRFDNRIYINQYEDFGFPTPIYCGGKNCQARVTHVIGHKRRGKLVPSIFRLFQNIDHAKHCGFKAFGNYEIESKVGISDVESALFAGEMLFRINILNDSEMAKVKIKEDIFADSTPEDTVKREYKNRGKMPCYVKQCGDLVTLYLHGKMNPAKRELLEIKVNSNVTTWKDFFFGIGQYRYFQYKLAKENYANAAIDVKFKRKIFAGVIDEFEYLECKPKYYNGRKILPIIRVSKKLKLPYIDFDKQFLIYGRFRLRTSDEQRVSNDINAIEFMTSLVHLKQLGEIPSA
ncbi:hypothetical protein, partial [Aliivibrio finisterrensis]